MYKGYITILLCCILAAGSQVSVKADSTGPVQGLHAILRMDKIRFTEAEDVTLRVHIKNRSNEKASFTVYEGCKDGPDYTTFQPVVFDMQGREIESIVPYRMAGKTTVEAAAECSRRTIQLNPGEGFIYPVDLTKLYKMRPDSEYRVKCYFLPDLSIPQVIYSENELEFSLYSVKEQVSGRKDGGYSREISPSEIVLLALTAEKNGNWENMVKYLNLEELIGSYPDYFKQYSSAGTHERAEIRERFIRFLSRERDDYLIDFEVLGTDYASDRRFAYVNADVGRFGAIRNVRYRYRYLLEKNEGMWQINSLEASIVKGGMKR